MYTILKLVFEWKREVPIGEVCIITPAELPEAREPLQDTTHGVLTREECAQNVTEIKQETDLDPQEQAASSDQLGLVSIPPLPSVSRSLPDAMQNLLVDFPGVEPHPYSELQRNATRTVPTYKEEGEPMDATLNVHAGDDEAGMSSHVIQ